MGLFKKINQAVTKSAKNLFRGGSVWGVVDKYVHKPVTKKLQDMLGIGALKDMAASQEESIRRQGEASKLDANNEIQNVTQFDNTDTDTVTGARRNKRKSGAFSSGIGLNY